MGKVKVSKECFARLWKLNRKTLFVVCLLGAFQFCHSFKPSDPYMVQIVEEKGISNRHYYNDISPFKTYAMLPDTILAAFIFEFFGYRVSLFIEALMAALSYFTMILANGEHADLYIILAEIFIGFSFSEGFIVNCSTFTVFDKDNYLVASSLCSVFMFVAHFISSAASSPLYVEFDEPSKLLYISLAAAGGCIAIVVFGSLFNVFKRVPRMPLLRNIFNDVKRYYRDLELIVASLCYAAILALHTLFKGAWKSLLKEISSEGAKYNGYISSASELGALIMMFVLMALNKFTDRFAYPIICLVPILSSVGFFILAATHELKVAASVIIVQNVIQEIVLAVGSAIVGKRMTAITNRIYHQLDSKSTEENPLINSVPEQGEVVEAPVTDSLKQSNDATEIKPKPKEVPRFAMVFMCNSLTSIIIQIIFMATEQSYGLAIRKWFVAYGFIALALAAACTVLAIAVAIKKCKKGSSD